MQRSFDRQKGVRSDGLRLLLYADRILELSLTACLTCAVPSGFHAGRCTVCLFYVLEVRLWTSASRLEARDLAETYLTLR